MEDVMSRFKTPTAVAFVMFVTLTIPTQLSAQSTRYKLIDLGALGGPASFSAWGTGPSSRGIVNQSGTTVGWADTSASDPFQTYCFYDCMVDHAFRSRKGGPLTDLGTLSTNISSAANWITSTGLIAGVSENGNTDPFYPGLPELHAVLWQHSKISDLGTLEGGYQSFAAAVNSSGQVVGAALNTTPDSNSMQSGTFWLWGGLVNYQYQTRAFLWDAHNGMQDLGTLPGGTDAQAVAINDAGQVVGYSYLSSAPSATCASSIGFPLATGSFIWDQQGGMQNIGGLGGTCTLASDLNNIGQVVGVSAVKGDGKAHAFLWQRGMKLKDLGTLGGDNSYAGFISDGGYIVGKADLPGTLPQNHHAILWTNGKKIDLGVLPGDSCSRAYWVNSSGQVVGNSENEKLCDVSGEHAFLWENGQMFDLDELIPSGSSLKLSHALAITDAGEIVGVGVPPGCPRSQDQVCGHAFVLIPCDESDGDAAADSPNAPILTDNVTHPAGETDFLVDRLVPDDNPYASRPDWLRGRHGSGGRCLPQGGECSDPLLPRCCPGLTCTFEGMRAHCLKHPF
jgi:probable HAF family extracellular repeat protein